LQLNAPELPAIKYVCCLQLNGALEFSLFSESIGYDYVTVLSYGVSVYFCQQGQQIRNKYADWRMLKDAKRRRTLKEFGAERIRINSLRKNDILPQELRVNALWRKLILFDVTFSPRHCRTCRSISVNLSTAVCFNNSGNVSIKYTFESDLHV
jgi:hypothetical protein